MRIAHGGLCPVCHREARGFGWFSINYSISNPRRFESLRWLCSRKCQDIFHGRKGVIDPSRNEKEAILAGGDAGGAWLDELGKTDLARLTVEEWETFLAKIIGGYCDALRRSAQPLSTEIDDGIPF